MNSGLYQFADNVIHTSDKDLGTETVAAVVITGLAVVFIGLILLIALVWLYGKIFQVINDKAAKKKLLRRLRQSLNQRRKKLPRQLLHPLSKAVLRKR